MSRKGTCGLASMPSGMVSLFQPCFGKSGATSAAGAIRGFRAFWPGFSYVFPIHPSLVEKFRKLSKRV